MAALDTVIQVNDISKQYRLGKIGTGTIAHDLNRWWHTIRGKENPYLKLGDVNDRTLKTDSDYVWALRNVSFEVNRGDVVGIIGRNGAGKSTLLKILSRTTTPTLGNIKIKGRVASLLEVGTGFNPELSGKENIFLNGAILGMTKREIKSKFDEIVDFSGVEKYVDTPVKRYSSGMYVRLAFAVAAHLDPEILIVDEVLAVGDAEFQKKAIGKMKDVSKSEGRTVLFVSHNLASIKTLCSKGILMKSGVIGYTGNAENTISEYLKSENSITHAHLKLRTDRQGNGKLRFTDFRMMDKDGHYVDDVMSGEPVVFELCYERSGHVEEDKLIVGMAIEDNHETVLGLIISDETKTRFGPLPSKGAFRLNVSSLMLRGEVYTVRLMAFENGTAIGDALDFVENAATMNVLPGDIYKTGKANRGGYYSFIDAHFAEQVSDLSLTLT